MRPLEHFPREDASRNGSISLPQLTFKDGTPLMAFAAFSSSFSLLWYIYYANLDRGFAELATEWVYLFS